MLDSKLLKAIRALGKTEISWLSWRSALSPFYFSKGFRMPVLLPRIIRRVSASPDLSFFLCICGPFSDAGVQHEEG